MDLDKVCDKVNRKSLQQVLRKWDAGSKLSNDIKSISANNLACVRVIKRSESKCFRIDSGER